MKDTPETRDKLIGLIGAGADAQSLLRRIDPICEKVQDRLRTKLVSAVKEKAGVDEVYQVACQIAALDMVYESIRAEAVTGARAQKTADELEAANEQ